MKIAIGKFGKSILFNSSKWGPIGGDHNAPMIYLNLAKNNPQNTYYIIGKSDWSKMPKEFHDKYPNIIDVWKHYDKNRWPYSEDTEHFNPYTSFVYDYLKENNIVLDFGFLMTGPASGANTNGQMRHWDEEGNPFYTPLQMFIKYVGPMNYYLNMTGLPYMNMCLDERYFPFRARDLFNRPITTLAQYDKVSPWWHIKSYDDVLTKVDCTEEMHYGELEKFVLIGEKRFDLEHALKSKTEKIAILTNGVSGVGIGKKDINRSKQFYDFIINNFPDEDISIYGKWGQWGEYFDEGDPRFKGPIKHVDIPKVFEKVKYTFIVPTNAGWVTPKFWEMINCGTVPFLSPYYDDQKHIPCPKFLRVNTPKELKERIEYLEDHPDIYEKLLRKLWEMLPDSYYDGSYYSNVINREIDATLEKANLKSKTA